MRTKNVKKALPAIISSLIIFTFFIWALINTFKKSLSDRLDHYVGFDNFNMMFSDPRFYESLNYTIKCTIIVLVITMVLSIALAMAMRRTFVGKKLMLFLMQFDVSIPGISCAVMMIFTLENTGFISKLCCNAGLIDNYYDFPTLVHDYNGIGVIITIVWLFLPFIALSFLSVLHSISNDQEDQAATLGIGKVKRFLFITLPTLKSSIAYTSILCIACVFGSFEIPSIVGRGNTLVMLAYEYYSRGNHSANFMEAYAISIFVFLVIAILASILLYYSISQNEKRDKR